MMKKMRLVVVAGALIVVLCIALWVLYKPVRIFFPSLNGVECIHDNICIDQPAEFSEAESLYYQGVDYVRQNISDFKNEPKYIFCKSQQCLEKFGFKMASAQNIGTIGTVVGPKGWKKHIINHEMIHHIQYEKLGMVKFLSLPTWFVEGMAYSLSQDPRETLLEPWQTYKVKFNEWLCTIEVENLWEEAKKL